jgi:hypothetical protein
MIAFDLSFSFYFHPLIVVMQHVIGLAISKKAARLQLETDYDNPPARTLYK